MSRADKGTGWHAAFVPPGKLLQIREQASCEHVLSKGVGT